MQSQITNIVSTVVMEIKAVFGVMKCILLIFAITFATEVL